MTIMEMVEQGSIWHLAGMVFLFILWAIMINKIGKTEKPAEKDIQHDNSAAQRSGTSPAITAAITAAVNEYRKTNN